ncbi:MAG: PCI domain-containing protein [Candidatus Thorarchaeota archaeon]
MNRIVKICVYLLITLFGIVELIYGGLGAAIYGLGGIIPESGLPVIVPLIVGTVLTLFGLFMLVNTIRLSTMQRKVVEVASAYKEITIEEMARQSGLTIPNARLALQRAIADGELRGRIEGNTFIREKEGPKEVVKIEREVMVTRKAPEKCYTCGAALNPQDVEWVGPDQIRCPHCGAIMNVTTERV